MQILINEKPIDFTLENENNLGKIITELDNWIISSGFKITSVEQDGKEHALDDISNWQDIPIDSIQQLKITASKYSEIYLIHLQTVHQFFTILLKAIEIKDRKLITELMNEYKYIIDNIGNILLEPGIEDKDSTASALNALIEKTGLLKGDCLESELNQLSKMLISINIIISSRMKEITDPFTELKTAAGQLKSTIDEISDVSVLLQTGQDRKAMDSIIRFTDLSEKIIRIYPFLNDKVVYNLADQIIDKGTFKTFYVDLNSILMELLEAFNANDSVLIGDLLEYEVVPRLEKLFSFINQLEKGGVA